MYWEKSLLLDYGLMDNYQLQSLIYNCVHEKNEGRKRFICFYKTHQNSSNNVRKGKNRNDRTVVKKNNDSVCPLTYAFVFTRSF